MTFSIVLPVMDRLAETKHIVALLCHMTTGDYELVVIDNGSAPDTRQYYERFIAPLAPRWQYVRNEQNAGVFAALQQGYQHSRGDVIAFLHNDVYLYERGWNQRVLQCFAADPQLGVAGFFGCRGISADGYRFDCVSSMLETESRYGARRPQRAWEPVAVLDGYSLICRRAMLDQAGGIDQGYRYHHYYDYDICLTSLARGYHNIVVNVPCAHPGTVTSAHAAYQQWINAAMGAPGGDQKLFWLNLQRFRQKWRHWLPLCVGPDFRLTRRPQGG